MSHRGSVSSKVKHTHTGMTEEFQLKTTGVRRKSTNGDKGRRASLRLVLRDRLRRGRSEQNVTRHGDDNRTVETEAREASGQR